MTFPIRAITLDLDDTLWPFAPIGARVEQTLDAFLREHSPATADMYPIEKMRDLRTRVFAENAHLMHDLSALRQLTIEHALRDSGGDLGLLDAAYEVFYAERNKVEYYPDSLAALERIAAQVPVAAVTNGNADLDRVGIGHLFAFTLGSREHGVAKPDASIFHAACDRLSCAHGDVLHVGDHIEMDVAGAARAGLRTCWINREDRRWEHPTLAPDLEFDMLTALADWLDAVPTVADRT
ncbi:HAD-IA family hydrolase [Luteimonas sp. 3794]|uniref:HAD family hydrolase n=1 Tax=Luteimonas sp. 3794 TaxID=2817730 RepID=UPI0028657F4C|nr:HAD-IA family hydrolase [Luteimonas sp. 3794]MDR6993261.1 putative hydrolase of the HAD superfamily [Luteimonas sp. 3794]